MAQSTNDEYYELRARIMQLEHENEELRGLLAVANHELSQVPCTPPRGTTASAASSITTPSTSERDGERQVKVARVEPRGDGPSTIHWLDVPFFEKEEAKRVGVEWNPAAVRWYAPPGVPLEPLARWDPAKRINLTCTHSEKETVKALGARWDADSKKWYVMPHMGLRAFTRWLPADALPAPTPIEKAVIEQRRQVAVARRVERDAVEAALEQGGNADALSYAHERAACDEC